MVKIFIDFFCYEEEDNYVKTAHLGKIKTNANLNKNKGIKLCNKNNAKTLRIV